MRSIFSFIVGFSIFASVATAYAAAPGNVSGLYIDQSDTKIVIKWTPLQADDIAYYRVYLNDRSILESGGDWTDFLRTEGSDPLFVFTESPLATDVIFTSVLAVNTAGEESTYFVEELRIDFSVFDKTEETEVPDSEPNDTMSEPESEPEPEVQEPEPQLPTDNSDFENATSSDAMEVETTSSSSSFAMPKEGAEEQAQGSSESTFESEPENEFEEESEEGGSILDWFFRNDDEPAATTIETETISKPVIDTMPEEEPMQAEVENLQLDSRFAANGSAMVTVQWNPINRSGVTSIVVEQSSNGGTEFGSPQTLPTDAGGVVIEGVRSASLGVRVRLLFADGTFSSGVYRQIILSNQPVFSPEPAPAQSWVNAEVQASVVSTMTTQKVPLTHSGAGMGIIATMALGGVMGWRICRK